MSEFPHCADVMEQIPECELSELFGTEENQTKHLPTYPEREAVFRSRRTFVYTTDAVD